ncbi:hypothetical protein BC831DRAFT_458951 [Entophlyctis helioformis]|nr:hypothetical protein BC831DRAFT_458951 [Entophlyctis helioformis]
MNNLPEKEFYTIIAGGVALAANAGFINVVSMAGVFPGVTVSHVTGSVSRVAISIFQEDWDTFFLVTSIVFSFMFGAFTSGYIVGDNKFKLGANYGFTLFLESGALFASFIFLRRELILGEWAAAFACGLQNAMVTSYSGLAVRTTHMTGICTDIGNILGQACRTDTKAELWRLKVHAPLLFGYLIGGVFGQIAWIYCKQYSLLFPCFFTGGVACVYLSLPYIKEATEQLKTVAAINAVLGIGAATGAADEYQGDPRYRHLYEAQRHQERIDHYAKLTGKNVDDDIQSFLKDLGEETQMTPAQVQVLQQRMLARGLSMQASNDVEMSPLRSSSLRAGNAVATSAVAASPFAGAGYGAVGTGGAGGLTVITEGRASASAAGSSGYGAVGDADSGPAKINI